MTLYLQERGALKQIFASFRARDPGETDDPGRAGVAIVPLLPERNTKMNQKFKVAETRRVRGAPTVR